MNGKESKKKRGCTSDELFIKVSCVLKIDEDIRYQGNFDLLNKLKFVQIFAISPSILKIQKW